LSKESHPSRPGQVVKNIVQETTKTAQPRNEPMREAK
jgi:hypothetical protein